MHVNVISGVEEARLIHLGVLQAVPVFDKRLLLCDIGGGSTELLVGERGEVLASRSLKLGAIRLTRRFFDGRLTHPGALDACRRHVRSTIAPFAREVRRLGVEVAVGSSGTIANLAEMAALRSTGARPRSVSNLVLTADQLDAVVKELVAAPDAKARAELPGLDAGRADIILAGAVILEQVVHELDLPELIVSDYALREGVLLDTWRRRHGGSLHHLSDLRRQSVLDLGELMDEDPPHSAQVARLALELFDATRDRHGLGDDAREILEAAALLCNVGMFLSHAQHHKHSYYVIRGTDRLAGFNDDEVERIALVARYHRKSEPKSRHPEWAALPDDTKREVGVLAGLLRVATGLDRNHAGRVQRREREGQGRSPPREGDAGGRGGHRARALRRGGAHEPARRRPRREDRGPRGLIAAQIATAIETSAVDGVGQGGVGSHVEPVGVGGVLGERGHADREPDLDLGTPRGAGRARSPGRRPGAGRPPPRRCTPGGGCRARSCGRARGSPRRGAGRARAG